MSQDVISKFTVTQSVIRDKFKKAYMNRLKHENNVNHAMKPFAKSQSLSFATITSTSAVNQHSKSIALETNDINTLCTRLQKLMNAQIEHNANHKQEIQLIISKLRGLGIIV